MRKLAVVLAVVAALVLAQGAVAVAREASLVGNAASSWQTNGTVWALAHAKGVVYLGGDFTSVRPPGAAAGTGEVARNHIAAFNAGTGDLITSFNHSFDVKPMVLAASPDGSRIYAGGDFTTVDGQPRARLAAFDTATGALLAWAPRVQFGGVRGIAVYGNTVYFGGSFSAVAGQPRTRLAAVTADTGALRPWAPTADATVFRVAAAVDGSRVIVGGYFTNLNGQHRRGTGSLDPSDGSIEPWASADVVPAHSSTCNSDIKDIFIDGDTAYFAAEGNGGGCFDGTFAAKVADGALVWKNTCLGATQAVAVVGGFLYKGSHAHNCAANGDFPEQPTNIRWHLLVEYLNNGRIGPWYPNTNGNSLGPRVFATDGARLFVGGDFTFVNSKAQQGFTRFEASPDLTLPKKPDAPSAVSVTAGTVAVTWRAVTDTDDENLIYKVYRDGSSTPIFTSSPIRSTFWILPSTGFKDTGLAPGSTHTYKVRAFEANGTNASSFSAASAPVTVAASTTTYPAAVDAGSSSLYWRLGEAFGTLAGDATGKGQGGVYVGTPTLGVGGAIAGDSNTAVRLNGSSQLVSSANSFTDPQTFSVELWFKSTSTSGGKLIGFGNAATGNSASYDRHVYMLNDGRLRFGVWAGHAETVTTSSSYNDGQWHYVVARLDAAGMALYVDAKLAGTNPTASAQPYDGYWRVGGDNLNGWPDRPSSNYLSGTVDEVAVYPVALTGAQVQAHYSRN
jgi:hypothetical protein